MNSQHNEHADDERQRDHCPDPRAEAGRGTHGSGIIAAGSVGRFWLPGGGRLATTPLQIAWRQRGLATIGRFPAFWRAPHPASTARDYVRCSGLGCTTRARAPVGL
jgi:hypothetical protein